MESRREGRKAVIGLLPLFEEVGDFDVTEERSAIGSVGANNSGGRGGAALEVVLRCMIHFNREAEAEAPFLL